MGLRGDTLQFLLKPCSCVGEDLGLETYSVHFHQCKNRNHFHFDFHKRQLKIEFFELRVKLKHPHVDATDTIRNG